MLFVTQAEYRFAVALYDANLQLQTSTIGATTAAVTTSFALSTEEIWGRLGNAALLCNNKVWDAWSRKGVLQRHHIGSVFLVLRSTPFENRLIHVVDGMRWCPYIDTRRQLAASRPVWCCISSVCFHRLVCAQLCSHHVFPLVLLFCNAHQYVVQDCCGGCGGVGGDKCSAVVEGDVG